MQVQINKSLNKLRLIIVVMLHALYVQIPLDTISGVFRVIQ